MSAVEYRIIVVALAGLLVVAVHRGITTRRWVRLGIHLLFLGGVALLLRVPLPFTTAWGLATKGREDEPDQLIRVVALVACFLSMIFGMAAQYFYAQCAAGRRRMKFDLTSFVVPFFLSPIVFTPLLGVMDAALSSQALSSQTLMLYFVAFQNGFMWKDVIEKRRHGEQPSPEEDAPAAG